MISNCQRLHAAVSRCAVAVRGRVLPCRLEPAFAVHDVVMVGALNCYRTLVACVYLLHFDAPLEHTQHYTGFCDDLARDWINTPTAMRRS